MVAVGLGPLLVYWLAWLLGLAIRRKARRPRASNPPVEIEGDTAASPVFRFVTGQQVMPRGRKPDGEAPLSNAERQARYRSRHLMAQSAGMVRARQPVDRRSCPQRRRDVVTELRALQAAYAAWLSKPC